MPRVTKLIGDECYYDLNASKLKQISKEVNRDSLTPIPAMSGLALDSVNPGPFSQKVQFGLVVPQSFILRKLIDVKFQGRESSYLKNVVAEALKQFFRERLTDTGVDSGQQ